MKDSWPCLLLNLLLLTSCLPELEPPIDEATVLNNNTSVRIDSSSSARTMFMLHKGDRIYIIEKQGAWYLVRDKDLIEGWMDESTILRDSTREILEARSVEAKDQPVQNTARTTDQVNLRLNPGRDTTIIRRLRKATPLEVLEQTTTPRPSSGVTDIWLKVRTPDKEIGWIYHQLMQYDVPDPLLPFTEGRTYTAILRLKRLQDLGAGQTDWFVVAEKRTDSPPKLAFDGIRVFIWNTEESQYETTLRLRNLRGGYPLELTGTENEPRFRFHVFNEDGSLVARNFIMRGTLPREIR